jgi:hypothetical protein
VRRTGKRAPFLPCAFHQKRPRQLVSSSKDVDLMDLNEPTTVALSSELVYGGGGSGDGWRWVLSKSGFWPLARDKNRASYYRTEAERPVEIFF